MPTLFAWHAWQATKNSSNPEVVELRQQVAKYEARIRSYMEREKRAAAKEGTASPLPPSGKRGKLPRTPKTGTTRSTRSMSPAPRGRLKSGRKTPVKGLKPSL